MLPAVAFAQAEELENPGTVAAVQDRAYRLGHELTLTVGALPLDAFTKTLYGQVSYTYHFSDGFAWQVGRGAYGYNLDTGLRDQLERDFGVLPTTFDEVQYMVGSDLIFSPLYGKGALFNTSVVHFESYLIVGATVFKYTHAFKPAVNAGLGFRLFQTKHLSYKLDLTDAVVVQAKPFNVLAIQLSAALNFGATE